MNILLQCEESHRSVEGIIEAWRERAEISHWVTETGFLLKILELVLKSK